MIAHYKLLMAKLRREQYGQSSERTRKLLDQLELQLEEAVATAAADEAMAPAGSTVHPFTRRKPVRAPFPAHLPRERVVIPGATACPCCRGRLRSAAVIPPSLAVSNGMASWRGVAGISADGGGVFMLLLLDDHWTV